MVDKYKNKEDIFKKKITFTIFATFPVERNISIKALYHFRDENKRLKALKYLKKVE